ncbi:SPFH domain-containing protein [Cerasicoccus maritimus]|uniref:SPFH domain-containing protein n=1 Tax=Cerasicoccus maritimus TaxID=490089 RepID=UPI002852BF1B|nr:SPFH domain-containing protein [Cerasicoccus maritimus]
MKYHKAFAGKALVRSGLGGRKVTFDGMFVFPGLQRISKVDITISNLSLTFTGPDNPLIAKDQQLFDLKVTLQLRVNDTPKDVLAAIDYLETDALFDLDERIPEMINDAEQLIRAAASEHDWSELADITTLKNAIIERVPKRYFKPGIVLQDVALDHIDKFPPEYSPTQSGGLLFRAH